MKNNRFWNWVRNEETGASEMYLYGAIAESTWFENDITPAMFRSELQKHSGDVTVFINSPGGDVFAASQIYTMLRNHPGKVTVKIDGIAASAASVVAMAGDETLISPTGMLMIHDPMTLAYGNKADMEQTITMLDEVKESILNAYVAEIPSQPKQALAADERRNVDECRKSPETGTGGRDFLCEKTPVAPSTQNRTHNPMQIPSARAYTQESICLLSQTFRSQQNPLSGIPIDQLEKRLALLKY
ncbi:MAG: head maturation protease, ClpP-related [Ruminococcus sp.]